MGVLSFNRQFLARRGAAVLLLWVPMRVLVVEDETKVAAFVKSGLVEHGFAVEICHDGTTATERAMNDSFDAIILDIMIPGRDGLSVLRKLREARQTVPVLLLTARGDLNERVEGLNLGADDYLPKPFAMLELVARLGALLRRQTGQGLAIHTYGDLILNTATREVKRGNKRVELTPREFALVECLLRTPGKVVTRTELSQVVWGYQFDPGTNFVDVAIQRLRRKLDEPFTVKMLQTIRGVGYALQIYP